ncbi:hypothetical protein OBBRIDRAFT_789953 [Obba rivulosa]|uniref:Uncharacterized protein n=1 Tax=Obba rivulosa TaxID=1052685 RepID=A0A8E2DQ84_9APHY|nr:hypothetical protein OBBRIDRAFT_789953 [Obba rivulosa]
MAENSTPPGLGTPSYIPSLINRIRSANPDLPVDSVVLQSILLCLVARLPSLYTTVSSVGASTGLEQSPVDTGLCAHLILRTAEEDVGLLANIVTITLTAVLGLRTHKHKIPSPLHGHPSRRTRGKARASVPADSNPHPSAFLRALFFHKPSTRSPPHSRLTTRTRSHLSADSGRNSAVGTSQQSTRTPPQKRSSSYSVTSPLHPDDSDSDPYDAASFASSRRPLLTLPTPTSSLRSRGTLNRPRPQRLRTDPLPSAAVSPGSGALPANRPPTRDSEGSSDVTPRSRDPAIGYFSAEIPHAVLPEAVVVTGLEHASPPAQRALLQVLTERRLVLDEHSADGNQFGDEGQNREIYEDGTWNLPHDFLLVYVCKWDPHERPSILRSLLDQFAMSADIVLDPLMRSTFTAYRNAHGHAPRISPFISATPEETFTPRSPLLRSQPSLHAPSHSRSSSFPALPSPPAIPPSELALLRLLAAPHPADVPGARACACTAPSMHAHTALHPGLRMYLTDLFAAARHHPELDGTLMTRRAAVAAEALVRAFRVLGGDVGGTELVRLAAGADVDVPSESGSVSQSSRGSLGLGDEWESIGSDTERDLPPAVRISVESPPDAPSERGHMASSVAGERLSPGPPPAAIWDVSEIDIARIFPRVVTHRLCVRNGPADEILGSVMFPAVPAAFGAGADGEEGQDGVNAFERRSVKNILVGILADV